MKRRTRWILAILLTPVAVAVVFALSGWIGSSIPRNPDWVEPETGVDIMVATNGIHTELVLPVVSQAKDWRNTFPSTALPRSDGQLPTHISVGWGEREVFLNTPEWSDLKPTTAIRIALRGGTGLMRIGHLVRPAPDENYRPLRMRRDEYLRLAQQIEAILPPLKPGEVRRTYVGFQPGDMNYDTLGRYTLGNTCNQWTSDTLAAAGVKIGAWTPFAGGVMKWVEKPAARTDK